MTIKLSATRLDLGTARLDNAAIKTSSQSVNALGSVSGATTINLALGSVVTATIAGATTFSVTNVPSSTQYNSFTLILTDGGRYAVTWMSGTIWLSGAGQFGAAPTLTAIGGTDVLAFFTTDNGASWRGALSAGNLSTSGNKLFAWGHGGGGRLGLGDTALRSSPTQVAGTWVLPSMGSSHAGALKPDGSFFLWGASSGGTLGNDNASGEVSVPTQLAGVWSAIDMRHEFSAAMRGTSLFTWGSGSQGSLGLGDAANRSSPVQVAGTWSSMGNGRSQGAALKSDGSLWVWGKNANGQLGLGDGVYRSSPVQLAGTWSMVRGGDDNTVGIKADGSLWTWGRASFGVLGNGNTATDQSSPVQLAGTWSSIHIMAQHVLAVKTNGTLWVWGNDSNGSMGLGDSGVHRSSPVQIAGTWSTVIGYRQGGFFSMAFKADNTLWVWGSNASGQLGLGDTVLRSSPVQLVGTWEKIGFGALSSLGIKQ